MLLFDWTRSSTTLTITRSAHGLSNGDKVVVRNVNESYVIGTVANAATNTFDITVADSGAYFRRCRTIWNIILQQ